MGTKAAFIAALDNTGMTVSGDTFTVNTGTNVVTVVGHGRSAGDGPLAVSSTGTAPAPLTTLKATGLLTATVNAINNQTVTIAGHAYTFKNTLTGAADEVKVEADVAAAATLTLAGNAVANETVTLGGVTYTFKASVAATANQVLVGASASDSLDNLIAAVNAAAGSGTLYGSATVVHPTVSAAAGAGDTAVFTAKTAGTGGNALASTETMSAGSFVGALFTGGAMNLQTSLANLKAAINGAAGSGTTYGTGTVAHATVESTASDATTLTLRALVAGADGNALATTETMTGASFGAATLTGGQDNAFYVIAIDADTFKLANSYANAVATVPVALDITTAGTGTHTLSSSVGLFADRVEAEMLEMKANGNRCGLQDVLESRFWDGLIASL